MVEAWLELTLDFCCLETESLNMTNTSSLFENSGLFVSWHWDWSCIFDWPFWEFWERSREWYRGNGAHCSPEGTVRSEDFKVPSSFPIPVLDQSQTHLQCLPLGSGKSPLRAYNKSPFIYGLLSGQWPGPSNLCCFVFRCSNHSCQWSSFPFMANKGPT